MKQIRFDSFGSAASVARCVEVPDPGAPSAWEVLVDVEACAINPADIARLNGRYGELPKLPATLGFEAVGRVVACGASVRDIVVGDRVILVGNDNWSQRRRVAATTVFKVPPELDVLQLAGLKISAGTAVELVRRQTTLERGDWIVQTAPLSSVGRAVMQLARHDGLRTLNIVRRPEAVAEVLEAGGDVAVEDGPDMVQAAREATQDASIRLGIDAVGGEGVARVGELLESGSSLINYGMLSGQPMQLGCAETIFRDITLKGYWITRRLSRMSQADRNALMGEAVDLLARGVLKAKIGASFPFDAVGNALRHMQEAGRSGKVFLLPNGPLK